LQFDAKTVQVYACPADSAPGDAEPARAKMPNKTLTQTEMGNTATADNTLTETGNGTMANDGKTEGKTVDNNTGTILPGEEVTSAPAAEEDKSNTNSKPEAASSSSEAETKLTIKKKLAAFTSQHVTEPIRATYKKVTAFDLFSKTKATPAAAAAAAGGEVGQGVGSGAGEGGEAGQGVGAAAAAAALPSAETAVVMGEGAGAANLPAEAAVVVAAECSAAKPSRGFLGRKVHFAVKRFREARQAVKASVAAAEEGVKQQLQKVKGCCRRGGKQ
jgi:hypothetical protein